MVVSWDFIEIYPLVMTKMAGENHHFSWENLVFQWSFSVAMLNYQRVPSGVIKHGGAGKWTIEISDFLTNTSSSGIFQPCLITRG